MEALSAKTGGSATLKDVPDGYFSALADAGFTAVYLMGVWRTGRAGLQKSLEEVKKLGLPDSAAVSSPFAITDYSVPDDLGGDAALKTFRDKAHAAGLLLVVDFVPNHVAVDHEWVFSRPELLMQGTPDDVASRGDVVRKASCVVA